MKSLSAAHDALGKRDVLGKAERRSAEPQRLSEPARGARRRLARRGGERVLALAKRSDHVVQLPLVDLVAGARVRLREHAHEVAGVVAAQVSGRVLPAAGRLRALGVEAGVRAEVAQHPIRTREDVGASVVPRVVEHAIALLAEETLSQRHLAQSERLHGTCGCNHLRRVRTAPVRVPVTMPGCAPIAAPAVITPAALGNRAGPGVGSRTAETP